MLRLPPTALLVCVLSTSALAHGAAAISAPPAPSATPATPATSPELTKRQPQIDKIVAAVSPQRIESYVRKLVSFETRHTMSDTLSDKTGIGAARRWIKAELERCGAGTRLQVAFDSHITPISARISKPTEVVNVVANLPGSQAASKERVYVVSGHYDSRNTNIADAVGASPGANDDASGTAAVMELACIMARHEFDATIVFMAVAAEEQGLLGAAHWAEQAKQKNVNIAGMFTNDIIGSSRADDGRVDDSQVRLFSESVPASKDMSEATRALLATGGENDSLPRQLARHVKEVGERYVPNFKVSIVQRRDRYLRGGDHMPFLERGYAALRFSEPNEDFTHQHQNVRKEGAKQFGDLPEYNDYNYIARVAKVNGAALASLALAPAAPRQVQLLTAQLQNDSTMVWLPNTEPDVAGYRIVWRETTAAQWQGSMMVGKVTEATVKLSKDNYFFGVQAVDADGNVSVATYPTPLR